MTNDELNTELYELGAAPKGAFIEKTPPLKTMRSGYIRKSSGMMDGYWHPATDIAQAIEMVSRLRYYRVNLREFLGRCTAQISVDHPSKTMPWYSGQGKTYPHALSLAVRAALVAKKEANK